jgi:hypothetical protein
MALGVVVCQSLCLSVGNKTRLQSPSAVFHKLFYFWLRKITTDPHVLAHINRQLADDRYPDLKIYISELTVDSYQYTP